MYNYRQLSVQFETPSLLRVVFDNPPINLVDQETLRDLHELTSEMEASRDLKVALSRARTPISSSRTGTFRARRVPRRRIGGPFLDGY